MFELTRRMKERIQSLEENYFRTQVKPRYNHWEMRARAYIRSHIFLNMKMTFHQDIEKAFVEGYRIGRNHSEEFETCMDYDHTAPTQLMLFK